MNASTSAPNYSAVARPRAVVGAGQLDKPRIRNLAGRERLLPGDSHASSARHNTRAGTRIPVSTELTSMSASSPAIRRAIHGLAASRVKLANHSQ
jgi:hypothetical protein